MPRLPNWTEIAARKFNIATSEVTDSQRAHVKRVYLAIMYNMGTLALNAENMQYKNKAN